MKAVIQRVKKAAVHVEGRARDEFRADSAPHANAAQFADAARFADTAPHAEISSGLLILLGVEAGDTLADADWLTGKISQMRIFSDDAGKMNLSLIDTRGDALIISQFTLMADTKKGNRPSFIRAARPEEAIPLYEAFVARFRIALSVTETNASQRSATVLTGVFGADMQVSLINDGPVTIQLDTRNKE